MKPIPTFTVAEYQLLRNLAKKSITSSNAKDMTLLNGELDRAIIIKEGVIEKNIIRINSFVTVEDVSAKRQMKFQIVLPSLANVKENKVSILAPLSIAIIGFKEKDQVEWELPAGTKTLKIIAVENLCDN
ncbi:GreA/GreB family elongation factor [Flavobacterium saliperosum S13]|uniref:Regulator of nucleoside diphosphate kinase n=2 Tax=Flavobacterium saliperosum TaxID=329186 RepID=A0A1G4VDF8_9FLAO|nr:GreA/GreB family elongation factor [Flavobacterium saliperosum]ESU26023.1 GreA/GreB family elongation factor [Flavobacterium saliperosum S13]SCX05031.1 regulator of nucleoside diphosphate kinase [Flavobacterium saliperosum]